MSSSQYDPSIERLGRFVVIGLTLWMLAVGLWEIAAPFGAGHAAVLPARGIIADNMTKYGIGFPVRNYPAAKPTFEAAYAHHPFGTYYLFAAVRWVLGRHAWAIRLVPVLVSACMPGLFYVVAKRILGMTGGIIAALGWAVLPITLAFAQFPSFEMFSLAAMLLVILAALRFEEQMSLGRMLVLLGAIAIALHTDWIAYLFVGVMALVAAAAVAFAPAESREQIPMQRFLQALLLAGSIVGVTLLLYVSWFQQAGLYEDWLGSARARTQGSELPLRDVLIRRRYWIEVMFTKPGIVFGLLGAVVMLVRLAVRRRLADAYPLLLLLVAGVHYVYFKNGADVHIYWPLPFAAQFCLGLGVLAASIESVGRWLDRRRGASLTERSASFVALGLCSVVALLVLPDGLRALDYSRSSGCRLNDDGQLNLQDFDKNLALESFREQLPELRPVTLKESMFPNWSQDWALQRPTATYQGLGLPILAPARYVLFDVRFAPPTSSTWAIQSRTRVIGPYWLVDNESRAEDFVAYRFDERSPSVLQRMFIQAHDPIFSIVADPYRTWEYRHHLSIKPNPEPPGLDGAEKRRIFHNVLIARGDANGAALIHNELIAKLDQRSARAYAGGLQLLGHRLVDGVVPKVEVYFLAAGPVGPNAFFDIRSRVLRAPRLSMVVKDDKVKKYGTGFEIHPSLWKAGMIYVSSAEVRRRPGHESFFGIWTGLQRPPSTTGIEEIPLFERK